MIQLFNTILYQPLLNLLVFFYNVIPGSDMGVAIILLTVVIKLILYPLSAQSIKGQKALQQLQPKIEEMKKKYKDDRERQAKELMQLYKNEHVNPLSSCLPLLIQLPILIAVYQVFITGLKNGSLDLLYPFIKNPGQLNAVAFGFLDLSHPNIVLVVLAGAAQFWQAKMLSVKKPAVKSVGAKDENLMAAMNKQMLYFMPLMTVVIGVSLPGGLVLYWFLITLLTALQQVIMFRKNKKNGSNQNPPAVIEGEKVSN